jgi:hypothetical protein
MSARDRLYEKKFAQLMRVFATYPRKRIARWDAWRKHVYIGTATMSKTPVARKMNCLIRMKVNRESI